MTDQSNPENGPDESVEKPEAGSENTTFPEPAGGHSGSAEFIEAEGPDVETSLSDADLSFLEDASTTSSSTASDEVLAAERLADRALPLDLAVRLGALAIVRVLGGDALQVGEPFCRKHLV
jgi:hypothetical protein